MKFLQIALVTLLLYSFLINATKLRFRSKAHTHTHLSLSEVLKYIRSFVIGVAMSLAGNGNGLYVCLPKSWRTRPASQDNPDGNTMSSFGSTASKVIMIVGKIIGFACKFKSVIMKFFGGRRRLMILKKRFFLLMSRYRWGFWNKIKKAVSHIAKKVAKGVKNVAHTVARGVKSAASKIAQGVKTAIKSVKNAASFIAKKIGQAALYAFKKVTGFVKTIISKVKAFFNSPFVKKIIAFFKCALTKAGPAIKNAIKVIKGFIRRIKDLAAGPAGWVKFIIDMICNFTCFTKCIDYLLKAIKGKGKAKAEDFGRFVGKLVYCVGSA